MKPSVVFEGRTEEAEVFFQRYQRSAAALRALGVGDGDVVALLLRNGPAMLELTLATRWIGALWCPINWHYRSAEVAQILADSGARILIAHADLLDRLDSLDLEGIRTYAVAPEGANAATPSGDGARRADRADWADFRDTAERPAAEPRPPRGAMFFTSGTTGRPKGIRREPATPEQVARGREVLRHVSGFEPGMRALSRRRSTTAPRIPTRSAPRWKTPPSSSSSASTPRRRSR